MPKLYTASEIIHIANETVAVLPSQAAYLQELASILSCHLRRAYMIDHGYDSCQLPNLSALIVAPTGTGKTYLLKRLTRQLGINLIVLDCSSLAREGWRGTSIAQQLIAAQQATAPEVFSNSIVYLDEVDKLRNWGSEHDQGSPIDNLLKLMEEPTVTAEVNRKISTVDIRKMTFLFGGAFQNHALLKIIADRICPKATIGFSAEQSQSLSDDELLHHVTMEDIAAYGFPAELCGRIGTILTIDRLTREDYRQLLTSPADSAILKYNTYLHYFFGVSLEISDQAVAAISRQAMASGLGARGITPLVDKLMRSAMSQVELDTSIGKVVLDVDEKGNRFAHCIHCPREPAGMEGSNNLFSELFQSRDVPRIASQLCSLYIASRDTPLFVSELEAFLKCALYYLFFFSTPDDFCWSSLEKLAQTLPYNGNVSVWDILIEDAVTSDHPRAGILMEY